MKNRIKLFTGVLKGKIALTASKSESNRALIIQALCEKAIVLNNLSAARDTQTLIRLLAEKSSIWDVLDAGTTMRFCTAYLAVRGHENTITGTERMQQRPIGLLAEALKEIGAEIQYLNNPGFPPLKISAIKEQKTNRLEIPGNVSSQFISALMLIAPALPQGLIITLTKNIFSRPYLEMTRKLMVHFGAKASWSGNQMMVEPGPYQPNEYTIESDWSGASYWYSFCAMNPGSSIQLIGLRENSFQGDQAIASIMEKMGVHTVYQPNGVQLSHKRDQEKSIFLDFKDCPDLAQTVLVVAACRGISLTMTGLESLRIKETDRIAAMQNELHKLNGKLEETGAKWTFTPGILPEEINAIETYEDHRMAMAFAPVACLRELTIEEPEVVKKSYPAFWDDMEKSGFKLEHI